MLSPEPSPRVLRSGAGGFSPFPADPRFSRATPDALFARIKEADAGNVVGSSESWSGNILREKARKRPVTSPGRAKLLGSLTVQAWELLFSNRFVTTFVLLAMVCIQVRRITEVAFKLFHSACAIMCVLAYLKFLVLELFVPERLQQRNFVFLFLLFLISTSCCFF